MADQNEPSMLLGQVIPAPTHYSPSLLYPISRAPARSEIVLSASIPMHGVDQWHAYEMSWLDGRGKPVVRVGRFTIPASSTHIIESKSLKLYLGSLNCHSFSSVDEAKTVIISDISAVAGAGVSLELLLVDDPVLAGSVLPGTCLDELDIEPISGAPRPEILQADSANICKVSLFSHLLRSLCPVTGQPDWASVWIEYKGPEIDRRSLLQYIIAYRQHQEFHEQCVERIFSDIYQCCEPELLTVQAFYTRRGGLDINPFRSTDPAAKPLPRMDRQ
ncbi:MAG: 7-cyano-7-deazaguanine reductase [Halioglobus sp.]|jgi:7-cyano-7-deazaguanine reductase